MPRLEDLERKIKDNCDIMLRMYYVVVFLCEEEKSNPDEKSFFAMAVKIVKDKAETILKDYKEIEENHKDLDQYYKNCAEKYIKEMNKYDSESYKSDIGNNSIGNDNLDKETVRSKTCRIAKEIVILLKMRIKLNKGSINDVWVQEALKDVIEEKKQELIEIKDKNPKHAEDIGSIINQVLLYDKIISNSIFNNSSSSLLEVFRSLLSSYLMLKKSNPSLLTELNSLKSKGSDQSNTQKWESTFELYYNELVVEWEAKKKSREIQQDMEELSRIAPKLAKELQELLRENFEQGDSEQGDSEQVDSEKKIEIGKDIE